MTNRSRNARRTSWVLVAGMLTAMSLLSACNTMSGLGKDVEAAGDAVSDTADDAKN